MGGGFITRPRFPVQKSVVADFGRGGTRCRFEWVKFNRYHVSLCIYPTNPTRIFTME